MIETRPAAECELDIVALGEVMLRLDPGEGRVRTARRFEAWEGGGEYNVARGLRKVFGLRAGVVTALADNEIGRLVENLVLQGGVDTSLIHWEKYDGIGRTVRNGLNFTERGFGVRGAVGVSDRGNTAISAPRARRRSTGTTCSVDAGCAGCTPGHLRRAVGDGRRRSPRRRWSRRSRHGTVVSFDLNYRPSLWAGIGGTDRAREVNTRLASHVDVMIGNEEDFTAALGFERRPRGRAPARAADRQLRRHGRDGRREDAVAVGRGDDAAHRPHRERQRLAGDRLVAGDRGPVLRGARPPRHPRPRRRR